MSASATSYPDRRVIAKGDRIKTCSRCGWSNVRPSPRRGFTEHLLAGLFLAPFRCRNCRHRFFRFSTHGIRQLGAVPATPLRVVPRRQRKPQPAEPVGVQPSPVKPELRAWALGGPVAPEEPITPAPLKIVESPVEPVRAVEFVVEDPVAEELVVEEPAIETPEVLAHVETVDIAPAEDEVSASVPQEPPTLAALYEAAFAR